MLFTIGFGMFCASVGGSIGFFQGIGYVEKQNEKNRPTVESIPEFLRKGKRQYI